ncbi:exo-beta-N-acetylmuramidase NamZ family protein [Taibaiella koreensis]|uniref:exo-beta-N-acetylmuramidase NamZ family protein n=1 Tax=Taibaiella koreensis TaxID=1268548 RepID=UPI000E599E81|nr:DUF1343 domain-containing protein [Taibaiella koreensis]
MRLFRFLILNALILFPGLIHSQIAPAVSVLPGAYHTAAYLPALKGKSVALLVNQTSEINGVLLPDTLLKLGVKVVKIFSPEHGFRGNADAGAHVKNGVDARTGLPVISLYGSNKKPSAEQLKDVDVLVYDLQDVGARFYTYVSTLQYAMEACGEQKKGLMILDRPDPLGHIVDGPVLEPANSSFVGMQPIPVVYGMTPGEYAKMLIGERWLKGPVPQLNVIACSGYAHSSVYELPVSPSPNLKNMAAIYLYPSLCFFEGTVVSLGRGTDKPFQQFGNPLLKGYTYSFTPVSMPGASDPPLKNQKCYGQLLATDAAAARKLTEGKLQIKWLLEAYGKYPEKNKFFIPFFEKLSGTALLRKQIADGLSEEAIRKSWAPGLAKFRAIRKKYLLYAE